MNLAVHQAGRFATAAGRWAGVGPYYAMFPTDFSDQVIEVHSKPGDSVLDPFAGRASSIFSAATKGRPATGIEINPVGWVYGQTKLHPASQMAVQARIEQLAKEATTLPPSLIDSLPPFFRHCFSESVLLFLMTARLSLDWRRRRVDRTVMGFILIYLHGKRGAALSNQMRQTKAMSPDYSVRWWKQRGLIPPQTDPAEFLSTRIRWRYAKGKPLVCASKILLGDSSRLMDRIENSVATGVQQPFRLLFTSPPYCGITNYFYDQWLRLWMLGGPDRPARTDDIYKRKFESSVLYHDLLSTVFDKCSQVMAEDACVYVRTDARQPTLKTTLSVLRKSFPRWKLTTIARPFRGPTQTALFGDKASKPGEVDIILEGP